MVIKIKNSLSIGLFIMILAFLMLSHVPLTSDKRFEDENPYASATTIVDKVYTFLAPEDSLSFIDMMLKEDHMYYIFVQIVTPHDCELNITIWDSNERSYHIFSSTLEFNQEGFDRAEIPFGTASSGNYTLKFYVLLNFNLNLYLRIEEGDLCLRDKISTGEWNNMIFYRVTQFHNNMFLEHNIQLHSDTSYKFYFGRVSPIATILSNGIYLYNNITDPNNIEFEIYSNNTLVSISEIQGYSFGTSLEGLYSIQLQIKSEVEYLNLAYAVIEDYIISEMDDNNQTGTPNNSTGYERGAFSVPPEIITILGISLISILSILGVFIYHRIQKQSAAVKLSRY